MGRKNHRQRTFTQSRYAARAGICQQHEYKEHKIVTHDWKVGRKNHRQTEEPRAGTLPAPASANSRNTKNIRLSHRTGNGQKEPPAEDVHPEQVRCPRRHLPTAGIQRTYDCHTEQEMGRKNHGPRTFTQSRYAARAGICQQLEYNQEHKIVTQDWKWAERTTGLGRSPRAGTLPAPASANSWNTKNIPAQDWKCSPEDVHPEQVRCPRRHLPTAGKEHTIVTQDWKWAERTTQDVRPEQVHYNTKNIRLSHMTGKWAERTTGRGRSPRAGTLPTPASANSRNAKNIRLSHRTGNGQKEPRAEDVHPEQVRCPRRHLPTAGIQRT